MSEVDATLVLLVRHGQTEWNAAGRVQGQTESELTPLGRQQAEALADWMAGPGGFPFDGTRSRPSALYASDLVRTRQTAAPIAAALGLEPGLDPDLREMHFGELEGLTLAEVEASHPGANLRLWGDLADPTFRAPGGESRADMHARSRRAIERIARRHPGEMVAVVSHGGVIGYFLRSVVGIPFDLRPGFSTPNGSAAAFAFRGGRFKLKAWGLVPPRPGPDPA